MTTNFGGYTKQIKNYMGVARDKFRGPTFIDSAGNERERYRIILYSAYSAFGLIGTEHNGIAVIDMQSRQVILDEFGAIESGMGGPTPTQVWLYERVMEKSDEEFMRWLHDPRHILNGRRRDR